MAAGGWGCQCSWGTKKYFLRECYGRSYTSFVPSIHRYYSHTRAAWSRARRGPAHPRAQDCLALAAIFSATDTVATLQVLSSDQHPVLSSLVFGEGVINDATSVVLLGAIARTYPPAGSSSAAGDGGGGADLVISFIWLVVTR